MQVRKVSVVIALLASLALHSEAKAQTGCVTLTESALLASFSDNAAAGAITPQTMRNFVCSTAISLPLVGGNNSVSAAANNALLSAYLTAAATLGNVAVSLPAGDYYYSSTLVPVSNSGITSVGGTTLHYIGSSGNAVENNSSSPLLNFWWQNISLDAGTSPGVVLHSPYSTHWSFGGVKEQCASCVFFSIRADASGGSNPNGNINAAFNTVDGLVQSGNGQFSGGILSLTGQSSPLGISTLNDFGDIGCLDCRATAIYFGPMVDTNTVTGRVSIQLTVANATGIQMNDYGSTVKTNYNNIFNDVAIADFSPGVTGLTAVKLFATREFAIKTLYLDEAPGASFYSRLSIDQAYTASYQIRLMGTDSYGSESIVTWQRNVVIADGPAGSYESTVNLPLANYRATWNDSTVQFSGFLFTLTNTASAAGSCTLKFVTGSTTEMCLDPAGNLSLSGASAAQSHVFQNAYTIATLPGCGSPLIGTMTMVSNGVASPTYNAAVSATGSTYDTVFCNGTSWVYK